jgi:hypothetical protein
VDNIWLDAFGAARERDSEEDSDAEQAARSATVEAAPWLLGSKEPERKVSANELCERLEP